jgi:dTDP-4-dehydrorhamnose reductase
MKIVILGASGMLGNAIYRHLSENHTFNVYGTVRSENYLNFFNEKLRANLESKIDVTNLPGLNSYLEKVKPDVVINCIGVIKQISDKTKITDLLYLNSVFPHHLIKISKSLKFKLVQISTDCVFSGKKGNYSENDFADAEDLYGISKFLGELSAHPDAITIRTSIIGNELVGEHSLLNWFLSQKNSIQGYTKAIFSGFPTIELAEIIEKYILSDLSLCGLFHVSSDPISKYHLLKLIAKKYQKNVEILESSDMIIDRSLDSNKFRSVTGYEPPNWNILIDKMYRFN